MFCLKLCFWLSIRNFAGFKKVGMEWKLGTLLHTYTLNKVIISPLWMEDGD